MGDHDLFAGYKARSSRRFTSIEGWRELSQSVYYIAGTGIRTISIDPQFDLERYHDDGNIETCSTRGSDPGSHHEESSVQDEGRNGIFLSKYPASLQRQHDRDSIASSLNQEDSQNPFSDANRIPESNSLERQPIPPAEEPYHVFSKRQTWNLVITIGAAGLFSGLSSNIYFPALNAIAQDLKISLQQVSLTITSYLIIQGLAPVFWGSFADALGRRPIYIASFAVYIIANIGLSFSPNFAVLLLFRGLQAAGSASTVSIGNGVIQDIIPPAERGAYISFYQAIRNFSIAIGPVLGGALSNFLGFRSIFIFLLIISSIVLLVIVMILPETLRSIAGNGSLRLSGIHQPLIRRFTKEPEYLRDRSDEVTRKKVTLQTFTDPLKLLAEKDILLNLIFGGVIYTIWSMVTSTTTGLFRSAFGLNELLIGLVFLPNGVGTIAGSTIVGNLMTRDYKASEASYKVQHNLPSTYKLPAKNLPVDFNIEYARQRNLPWITALFVLSVGAYGFTLGSTSLTSRQGWIAVPLVFQFLIAATSNAVFAINTTLVSDLCPGKGASSTAINNLVRCGMGAVGVAFSESMVAAVGPGFAFLGLALITVACVPLVVANWYYGMRWRTARIKRQAELADKNRTAEKV